jgi:glycosyltransferase involved in cell wall biosynthesis
VQKKKILIISRKFPPSVGGMQAYTYGLVSHLKNHCELDTILLSKGQLHLFWFLPYALLRACLMNLKKKYDVVYVSDALLAPLGLLLGRMFNARIMATVHGLDITFANFFYQRIIPSALSRYDKVACVSRNTLSDCLKRGIPESLCVFIPNGVNCEEFVIAAPRDNLLEELQSVLKIGLRGKKILLTTGRLVERKGVAWFIKNCFAKTNEDFVYLICGDGPLKSELARIIRENKLTGRAFLLGKVDFKTLVLLYNCADLFVMPNQRIKDNPEGFGIVALEAASAGLSVVANNIDGIGEAVLNGKTGWLIEYNNTEEFLRKIESPALDKNEVRENVKVFSWDNLILKYLNLMESV